MTIRRLICIIRGHGPEVRDEGTFCWRCGNALGWHTGLNWHGAWDGHWEVLR